MSFICRICCQTFEQVPQDAIKIGEKRGGYQLYRFLAVSLSFTI